MKYLTIQLLLFLLINSTYSQLLIENGDPILDDFLNKFVGKGINIENPKINCKNSSYASFKGGSSILGIENGIILSTSDISMFSAPANMELSVPMLSNVSDSDLIQIEKGATFDACILEFDMIPSCSEILVKFVFASEEYPEFVDSKFNDAFGFFISGPNPNGGNYTSKNIATITGDIPCSIRNINFKSNSTFFVDNAINSKLIFDGLTVPIVSTLSVVPCEKYHFKLAIADAMDAFYDSGVFVNLFQCNNSFSVELMNKKGDCSGVESQITANVVGGEPPYTFVWSPVPKSGQGTNVISGLEPFAEYTVSVTDKVGCSKPIIKKIINVGVDDVKFENSETNQTICSGAESKLLTFKGNVPDIAFKWKSLPNANVSGTLTAGEGDIPVHTLVNQSEVTQIVKYEVIPYSNLCEGKPVIYTISVFPEMKINCTTNKNLLCAGEKGQITIKGMPNSMIEYNFDGGENKQVKLTDKGELTLETVPLFSNQKFFLLKNYYPDMDMCADIKPQTIEFKIVQLPEVSMTAPTSFCEGDEIQVIFKGTSTAKVNFLVNSEPTTIQLNDNGEYSYEPTVDDSILIEVKEVFVSSPTYCVNPIKIEHAIKVVKIADPVIKFDGIPCFGNQGTIEVKGLANAIISSTWNQNLEQEVILDNNGVGIILLGSMISDIDFELIQIKMGEAPFCSKELAIKDKIKIYDPKIEFMDADVKEGCNPLVVKFSNQSLNAEKCQWDLGDGTIVDGCDEFIHTYTKAGTYTVKLKVIAELETCIAESEQLNFIYVEDVPKAFFISDPDVINSFQPTLNFLNKSTAATTYLWDFGDLNKSTDFSPMHTFAPFDSSQFHVTLTAFSKLGCVDTFSRILKCKDYSDCFIPNTFTPDLDNFNAYFKPVFTYTPLDYSMIIFNRWGEIIFKTEQVNEGWGMGNQDEIMDGVYSWVIKFTTPTQETKKLTGHVSVLR